MNEQKNIINKVEHFFRLLLSDFMRLFFPNSKKVFTWLEILLFYVFIGFLCSMALLVV